MMPAARMTVGEHDDLVLEALRRAAESGQRCPTQSDFASWGLPYSSKAIQRLARAGKVRAVIEGRNWRAVEILEGPAAGRSTQRWPRGAARTWTVIDRQGIRRCGS